MPESRFSSRSSSGASASSSRSIDGGGGEATRAELRLRVLWALPQTHQRYLFGEVRKLCRDYLGINRIGASEMSAEELVSEVWQKLLGTVSLPSDDGGEFSAGNPNDWSTNPNVPADDGRVIWLIEQIGGSTALAHRYEDVLRQRYGRGRPGKGRPIVQFESDEDILEIESSEDDINPLREGDARRVWQGLLVMASREFRSEEDAAKLLQVLTLVPDLFETTSGTQWPVTRIVALLNRHFPPPDWRDRRVEDAKRRLANWINRLVQKNALDAIDLEALFARVARQQELDDRPVQRKTRGSDLQS